MNQEKIQARPEENKDREKENEPVLKRESKRFSGKITERKLDGGHYRRDK